MALSQINSATTEAAEKEMLRKIMSDLGKKSAAARAPTVIPASSSCKQWAYQLGIVSPEFRKASRALLSSGYKHYKCLRAAVDWKSFEACDVQFPAFLV